MNEPCSSSTFSPLVARSVARHALGWLVAANLVGVWLAILLLWPEAGEPLAPFTYGRWAPLHLDWQLYGWCALPLVGVLLAWNFAPSRRHGVREAQGALQLWTLVLLVGGVTWLAGHVSGKLFLDWHGWTRGLLPTAMVVLWLVLAAHVRTQWLAWSPAGRWGRAAVLAALATVPAVFYWSTARSVFPAVNPDSGGATGSSLLGSSLGIVTLFLALPSFLGVKRQSSVIRKEWMAGFLAASWGVFVRVEHGHASHHDAAQVVALGVLLAWIPLLALHWRAYAWPASARPWIAAALGWWALLVASGWLSFLPGVSEALKFTHGLVAHAHLAMAGLVSSVNGAILVTLRRVAAPRGVWAAWQLGSVAHVVVLAVVGVLEVNQADELFRGEGWTQVMFALRLGAGVVMTMAAARWWVESWA